MNSLTNKHILLGVTGGIAAYKSAELIRKLKMAGATVQVVMTEAAQEFITPLTMQALSGYPVHTDLLDSDAEAAMGHIQLARWADLVLIAPASADFIAKLARAEGADLLSTICLATRAPIAIAPAMNQVMWDNAGVQANLAVVGSRKVTVLGPGDGSQACGETGPGRMLEPEELVQHASAFFQTTALTGRKVVITAGPTREAIDPVRYISNHSSGKMGYAMAEAAAEAGAQTILVTGPTSLSVPERVTAVNVVSAQQMYDAVMAEIVSANIFIGAAAVADYRPMKFQPEKIKKTTAGNWTIELVENPDIISDVAKRFGKQVLVVGFAAETENLQENAQRKLHQKKIDLIIANDVSQSRIGFNSDYNAVTVFAEDYIKEFEETSKNQLARNLMTLIAEKQNSVKE